MMMKAQVFGLLLLMSTIQSWSQQIERHVTCSAEGFFNGENESISWTIGEPAPNTISNDIHKLTQGLFQISNHSPSKTTKDVYLTFGFI